MQARKLSPAAFCAQSNPHSARNARCGISPPSESIRRAAAAAAAPSPTRVIVDRQRRKTSSPTSTSAVSALSLLSLPRDPGDWDFSPEWYGSQGGGYGRDDGVVVYRSGDVAVTSHAASSEEDEEDDCSSEWRVLRFGDATRQSVCRVRRTSPSLLDPTCLAFEYTKTLVALSLALLPPPGEGEGAGAGEGEGEGEGGEGTAAEKGASKKRKKKKKKEILCVGVGGGSVPAALAALRPDAEVSAFEVDERVVGSWPSMGLAVERRRGGGESAADEPSSSRSPPSLPSWTRNLRLEQQCGAEAVAAVAASAPGSLDLLIVDAFDNKDRVPSIFTDPDSTFFKDAKEALGPRGAVLINLHCGPRPGPAAALAAMFSFNEKDSGDAPSSVAFDTSKGEGKEAVSVARAYAAALLDSSSSSFTSSSCAFLVAAKRQQNAIGVIARAGLLALRTAGEEEEPASSSAHPRLDASALSAAASRGAVACAVPLPFDVGSRANYGLLKL